MDGVRELRLRNFFGGERADGHRGRIPEGLVLSMLNLEPRRSDGAIVKRNGRTRINTAAVGSPSAVRKLLEFLRRGTTEPAVVAHDLSGVVGFSTGGNFTTLRSGLGTADDLDACIFNRHLFVTSLTEDAWVWNGSGAAAYPDDELHEAFAPVAALCMQRASVVNTTVRGPFFNGDRVWYVFAFEIGSGTAYTDDLGFGATPTGIPGVALMLRNTTANNADGRGYSFDVPVPQGSGPARGIRAVRVYRTRRAVATEPTSLADFFFAGRVAAPLSSSIFTDNVPDSQLGFEQPAGPPLALPRARHCLVHHGRIVLGELRSPRAAFAFVGGLPISGGIVLTIDNSAPHISAVTAGDGSLGDVSVTITTGETLASVVNRFNALAEELLMTGTPGGQNLAGDRAGPGRMVLIGDGDVVVTPASFATDLGLTPIPYTVTAGRAALEFSWTAAYANRRDYPSEVQVGDIQRPLVANPLLRFKVGDRDDEPVNGLARYRGPAGRTDLLVGKRHSTHALLGDGQEVEGVIDLVLADVSRDVGFFARRCHAEAPEGVYFASQRGVELFNGSRVLSIPLSDFERVDVVFSINNAPTQMAAVWFDGRYYLAGVDASSNERLFVYDSAISSLLGDPRRAWFRQSFSADPVRALGVWNRTAGSSLLFGSSTGFVDRTGSATSDPGSANINASLTLGTIEPQPGRRVRFRTVRPRYRKASGSLSLSIRFDERTAGTAVALPTEAGDEVLPLVLVGMSRNPRARRVELALSANDTVAWEFYGVDLGFVPSEGALVGAR